MSGQFQKKLGFKEWVATVGSSATTSASFDFSKVTESAEENKKLQELLRVLDQVESAQINHTPKPPSSDED